MSLPPGWEAKTSNGRIVFINHVEKKTQYEDPRALPPGWSTAVDPASGRQVFIDHSTQATSWLDPRPPPFLSDAPASSPAANNGAPSYAAAAPIQVQSARYGPAYAATSAPMATTQVQYVQPQFTTAPVPYGGVQSSSANTNGPNGYAQPAFAVAPAQYAQPQYVVATTNGIAPAAIYVPVQPLLAPSVMSPHAAKLQQTMSEAQARRWPRRWIYSLFDCSHGPPLLFCRSCFCPCCVHTEVTAMRKGRSTPSDGDSFGNCVLCCCCGWAWTFITCTERMNTRQTLNISQFGDFCTDCCVHCCCWGCAHTQEWLELRTRKGLMPLPPDIQLMD